MIKICLLIILTVAQLDLLGQVSLCDPDSTKAGILINKLINESTTGVSIKKKDDSLILKATRLCEHHYLLLDSLDKELKDDQVEKLTTCDNGTLTAVGFILTTNRTMDKQAIIKKLNEIIDSRYRIITNGCSDAIQTLSLGQYCYNLLTRQNSFIIAQVTLTRKEKKEIEDRIIKTEKDFFGIKW